AAFTIASGVEQAFTAAAKALSVASLLRKSSMEHIRLSPSVAIKSSADLMWAQSVTFADLKKFG
ncbi:hypothetical protein, partial [Sinorhizobium medicae]|uniref:hypothetical protein n=1 Tax=Sinorhizobium medicae TaxID=110321 RepID=UPI00191236DB